MGRKSKIRLPEPSVALSRGLTPSDPTEREVWRQGLLLLWQVG